MESDKTGKIIVKGFIYPGTIITINGISKTIDKLMESVIIVKEKGEIVFRSIW